VKLDGLRVAALATNGFEASELTEPMRALRDTGANVSVISLEGGSIQGETHGQPAATVPVDRLVNEVNSADYDAILIPGGVRNPDRMRMNDAAVRFVREMADAGKPMAVICHGPWMLVEADVVGGRRLTSWPSLRTDIVNAGGEWIDAEVVVDHGLVTSRKPDDIPAFNARMLEEFAEGPHPRHTAGTSAPAGTTGA
jgi:protease I